MPNQVLLAHASVPGPVKDWLGYLGAPVAAAGVLLREPAIVASGLSFLLLWRALSLRGAPPGRRGGNGRA